MGKDHLVFNGPATLGIGPGPSLPDGWVVIVARLLPGVRTFVSAAAGASTMRYGRFAASCGIAAVAWATIWVVGGAALVGCY